MKQIIIKSKKNAFGEFFGRHTSKFKGIGIDFKELREYIYGEDAKRIDWKISAKLNKPFIKEFEEERELNIIIAILVSGSLHFGSKRLKSELVAELVGTISYLATNYEDRVRVVFADNKPIFLKPTKSKKIIPHFIEKTLNYPYLGKDYIINLDFLNRLKKGVLFLIGDFYKIPTLKFKHETYALIIRDKLEEDPIELKNINIIDPIYLKETNYINPNAIKTFVSNHDKNLYKNLKKEKIPFTKIYTDDNIMYKLWRLLK